MTLNFFRKIVNRNCKGDDSNALSKKTHMTIDITLTQQIGHDGKIKCVYPTVNCNLDFNENYSADYLRKFIPKLRDLLDEQLNNALIINK